MIHELERRFHNLTVYPELQVFLPGKVVGEQQLNIAVPALLPFLGPKSVGEVEFVRQFGAFALIGESPWAHGHGQ